MEAAVLSCIPINDDTDANDMDDSKVVDSDKIWSDPRILQRHLPNLITVSQYRSDVFHHVLLRWEYLQTAFVFPSLAYLSRSVLLLLTFQD